MVMKTKQCQNCTLRVLEALKAANTATICAKWKSETQNRQNLKPIFDLEHCKSITGLTNGCKNKTIPKMNLVRHRWIVGAFNGAKRAKI